MFELLTDIKLTIKAAIKTVAPIVICVIIGLVIVFVGSAKLYKKVQVSGSDMTNYESYDPNTLYRFVDSSVSEMKEKMDNGETFVIYFGFSKCPWCNDVINYINRYALYYYKDVLYVDTRADSSWKTNSDITDFDVFVELCKEHLTLTDEGEYKLYVPMIIFVVDGNVELVIKDLDYNAKEENMPNDVRFELEESLKEGFKLLCGD